MMVLMNRLAVLVQQLRREAIRADLERERPVGRRHESRGNQRAHDKGQQHDADEPLTMHLVEHCAGHEGETCLMEGSLLHLYAGASCSQPYLLPGAPYFSGG